MKNKVIFHLHDDTSNCNGFADSCTNFKEYIKLAKRDGDKSIAFSNHGGIYDWIKKKQECDKAGIKYIHGVELYMCHKLEDNDRGYHIGLYAKNWEGVKELNTLMSIATLKHEDPTKRHAYFNPRLSLEEIKNTSDNIIVTTACIQSMLWQFTEKHNRIKKLSDESQLNTAEKNKLNKLKVETMNEYDKTKFQKMKSKDKEKFLIDIKFDLKELANHYKSVRDEFLKWIYDNKHRCFLEVQYHNMPDQLLYNKLIMKWNKTYSIPIIAGTDTHSSNEYKAECRKILQKSKDSFYGDEDKCDLVWKNYDELFDMFKKQGVLEDSDIEVAINNTVVLSDMVEEFKLDKTFKYPNLYKDADLLLRDRIEKKFKNKLDNNIIDKNEIDNYRKMIEEEFDVFKKQGMESFILFMSELLEWCDENGIPHGDRGSVGGSMIAYIIDITDIDPIIWKTVFSRFCNADRVSLGDIDVDFCPEDRKKVYKYIIDRFTPEKTAYILTLGTVKDRGTIDTLAKGLDYHDLGLVKQIKNKFDELHKKYKKIVQEEVNLEELEGDESDASNIDFDYHNIYMNRIRNKIKKDDLDKIKESWNKLKSENKEVFYYFDGIKGTIISKGNHPAGIIGSPITLKDNLSVHYKNGDVNFPISSCAMKAVDSLNFTKFDILGLKTLGIIKDAYEYMGVKWKKSHEINWNDKNVWDNMITHNASVFQFEGNFAFKLLSRFKPRTINHMSMINACIRPSGKSYRDRLIDGEINKNPSKEIDELLKDNNGYLIFQEDTIKFLTDVCGFSGSMADSARRCVFEDTEVMMSNGNTKKIKDVSVGDSVICVDKHGMSDIKKVTNVFDNGVKYTIKINTIHNKEIICTKDHKILTQEGWKRAGDLSSKDSIMTLKDIRIHKDSKRPVKIKNIEEFKKVKVFDIEVEDNHNYVANDLIVHNCIGKKDQKALKEMLPKILDGYCDNSEKPREIAKKEGEEFVQIISDSSEYQFGYNHSTGYSMNGYRCVDIRTYNPLELTTAYLNRADNDDDILLGTDLAKHYGFKIKPIQFRKSMSKYNFDKEHGYIYKGMKSIKNIGKCDGDELYQLKDNQYETFIDLLTDISNKTSINKSKVEKLIKLDFFTEFGKAEKLLKIHEIYYKWNTKKTASKKDLPFDENIIRKNSEKETDKQYSGVNYVNIIKELSYSIKNTDISLNDKIKYQEEYLGYLNIIDGTDKKRCVIVDINVGEYNAKLKLYCLATGSIQTFKIKNKEWVDEINLLDIIKIRSCRKDFKKFPRKDENGNIITKANGKPKHFDRTGEMEWILESYIVEE